MLLTIAKLIRRVASIAPLPGLPRDTLFPEPLHRETGWVVRAVPIPATARAATVPREMPI